MPAPHRHPMRGWLADCLSARAAVQVPAKQLTLEDAVEYVEEGEFVEVTPEAIRMYKASAK